MRPLHRMFWMGDSERSIELDVESLGMKRLGCADQGRSTLAFLEDGGAIAGLDTHLIALNKAREGESEVSHGT